MGEIRNIGVLGSGVMGSGIAAHIANAGIPVVLLDIAAEGPSERSSLASGAIARMLNSKPAPLMAEKNAKLITPGNIEDDIKLLAECDWICEAVTENVDIKRNLYARVDGVRQKGSIVTSNTSTIPLSSLLDGMPDSLKPDFAITHFFNPTRYMRLLEVVLGPDTHKRVADTLFSFADYRLGKDVVLCKDTPAFIANRIGIYWSVVAITEAMEMGLSVEEADAIVGRPMGIPKTGIFGLMDLTGIDLAPHINELMTALLPETDPFRQAYKADGEFATLITQMIGSGYTGRKGKGGFYRLISRDGERIKEARNLKTGEYHQAVKPRFDSINEARKNGLRALVEHSDKGGRYAWRVLSRVLSYAATLVPEVSNDILSIDRAMRSGYAWKRGPFELIDELGSDWFSSRLHSDGLPVPDILGIANGRTFYRERKRALQYLSLGGDYNDITPRAGSWRLVDFKRGSERIVGNRAASIWDLGDGVACLELHSKLNSINAETISMIREASKIDKRGFRALVIGNDSENFSVGANIGLALFAANTAMWPVIEQSIRGGQEALLALKYSSFPVVGAASGMALGGGCELLMHCDAIQAHSESYIGLVEFGVGLIPGWGGTKELLLRNLEKLPQQSGPMPPVAATFETISLARVSTSAAEAKGLLFLRSSDGITMNRDRVLSDAKQRALDLFTDYTPPEPRGVALPGATGCLALRLVVDGFVRSGKATAYDGVIAGALAKVVTGGETDVTLIAKEKDLLDLETEAFLHLVRKPETLDRMEHMLETGKPLRN